MEISRLLLALATAPMDIKVCTLTFSTHTSRSLTRSPLAACCPDCHPFARE